MDEAYNQHAKQRRKNRSSTNVNHLSLAPLTSKFPLTDVDALPDSDSLNIPPRRSISYLQGKSAPTTPGLLSKSGTRSPSRARLSIAAGANITKSKSAIHLAPSHNRKHSRNAVSGTSSPNHRGQRDASATEGSDGDWMFRAAALMSSEAREFKGQSWLVSRASSTSLTGGRDSDDEGEEHLDRERAAEPGNRRGSRRGSMPSSDNGFSPLGSRQASRPHSRAGSRARLLTPSERLDDDDYFPQSPEGDEYIAGPDFVNLDERLEALGLEAAQDDEAAVRRLVRREQNGASSWMGNILGWTLFSVEENEEESDSDDNDEGRADDLAGTTTPSVRHMDGASNPSDERIPAPRVDEGGWKDAAWLLSVASKVIL